MRAFALFIIIVALLCAARSSAAAGNCRSEPAATGCTTATTSNVCVTIQPAPADAARATVTGYRLRVGAAPGRRDLTLDLGDLVGDAAAEPWLSQEVPALGNDQTLYFAVTAYGPGGESAESNEKPLAPNRCVPPGTPTLRDVIRRLSLAIEGQKQSAVELGAALQDLEQLDRAEP